MIRSGSFEALYEFALHHVERQRQKKWDWRTFLEGEVREMLDFPSFVGIRVGDSFDAPHGPKGMSPREYVYHKILEEIGNLKILYDHDVDVTIKVRKNSTYRFKRSWTSIWEMDGGPDLDTYPYRDGEKHSNIFRDCDHQDVCRDGSESEREDVSNYDEDYINDWYYAVVDAKDISKFIEESGEMINGEDCIDPISDGKFHNTEVNVISEKVLPEGFEELVERMEECRNKHLVLFVTEKGAKEFIKEFEEEFERLVPTRNDLHQDWSEDEEEE